jgi:GTP pyrophosphokinase
MPVTVHSEVDGEPFSETWFERVTADLDDDGRALLGRAVQWVREPLQGLKASTGEPLTEHGAGVVSILATLGTDAPTRASALLTITPALAADVPGDATSSWRQIFGAEVVTLAQGTRALLRLSHRTGQSSDMAVTGGGQKEMQRKMLLAMAADLRIVLLRLASRLQSLRWYARSRQPCPEEFARETTELYTPLANRLGIWQIKWEMEDLAFRFLEPDTYRGIAHQLEEKRTEREAFIDEVVGQLQVALAQNNIAAEVSGRPKHIYSIWNKMRIKHLDFSRLYDLRALRVIVDDERACYAVLALVHSLWTPVSDEFDDYISRPKPNGYRSLHTVVVDAQNRAFEVQIRTHAMHQFAEYGMAAHWRYKEAGAKGGTRTATSLYDKKISWMRQLLATEKESAEPAAGATDGRAAAGPSTQPERIYVMTPQARVIELPAGATPIDFAYYLHTDLGHRCRGARVDGQMVPLLTRLKTGQTVEIVAAKSGGPSRDWLNPQMGYLASPRSRSKVRAWFNAVELQQRIAQGQALVEKELQRLGKTAVKLEQLAQQLGFARADDLYVAAAKEEFSLRQIDHLFKEGAAPAPALPDDRAVYGGGQAGGAPAGKSGVLVVGVDALMTQLARCCRPAPPDRIAGFVTRGRGVSIHREGCASYAALAVTHPERVIEVAWGDTGETAYPVDISVRAQERDNLLRDVSDAFGRLRIKVVNVNTQSRRSLAHMVFTVEVKDGEQIAQVLTALNELKGVTASRR